MSERRKTRKRIEYVIGIGFLICVLGIGILFHWIQTDEKYSEGSSKQSWKIYNDRCDVSGHVCTFAGISGDTVI